MSYEIIGISGSRQFEHHGVRSVAALNIAAADSYSNISPKVSEAVGKRSSARSPDTPSSTR